MTITPIKNIPNRVPLAHLPTPIEKMERLSATLKTNLYLKRDDYTGSEVSGNKIRKLEYAICEALSLGAKTLITCGGIQSNHARATVAAARKLGLGVHLVLRSEPNPLIEGNYLMNQLMGAKITLLPADVFASEYEQVMEKLKSEYDALGTPAYILPIGASNGIGNFGYYHAFEEILDQEKALGLTFDTIVCTVGSGGTYGGLFLGNYLSESNRQIIGFNISSTAEAFKDDISKIVNESLRRLELPETAKTSDIAIIDGYAGLGYALSTKEEMAFIMEIAQSEGLILDPVYTGKAFRGLIREIEKGQFNASQNILFIHTGGLMGFVPKYFTD